jgi:dolichyl-phosphate-mannose--protein O-mannosyl transferase
MTFQEHFYRHFVARVIGLIVVPLIVYLSFFWVHFAILTRSGTGDTFMSPRFQESLAGNELLMNSIGKCLLFLEHVMCLPSSQISGTSTPLH